MCNDCAVLYEKMKSQEREMYSMKKTITSLRGELRYERKEKEKLLKEKRQNRNKQHYRNGQKRGKTRNG